MATATEEFREEATVAVAASPDALFAYLDDPARMGAHMQRRSPMMLGGRMSYEFDDHGGRSVGSIIRMSGRILGLRLAVDEVVTELDAPRRKVWKTVGAPRLLVIAGYTMGFEIERVDAASRLRVFIDYEPRDSLLGRPLTKRLARMYARWCVERIASDAVRMRG